MQFASEYVDAGPAGIGPGATSAVRVATRRQTVIPARRPRLPRHGPRADTSTAARFDGLARRRASRSTARCRALASSRSHDRCRRGGCAARTSSSRISASRSATRPSASRNPDACSREKNGLNDLSRARKRRQSTRIWWTSRSSASRKRESRTASVVWPSRSARRSRAEPSSGADTLEPGAVEYERQ